MTPVISAPLIYELGKDGSFEFHFINGQTEVSPFPGLADVYPGPFYRYYDQGAAAVTKVAASIKNLSASTAEPEAYSRELRQLWNEDPQPEKAQAFIREFAEHDTSGPYDGLLGFSEGASIAANLLIDQRYAAHRRPFKCAIFLSGFPPFDHSNGNFHLADDSSEIIRIPTGHILGAKDPARPLSKALFNLCDKNTASFYEHGQGHNIPWAQPTTKAMANLIREVCLSAAEKTASF